MPAQLTTPSDITTGEYYIEKIEHNKDKLLSTVISRCQCYQDITNTNENVDQKIIERIYTDLLNS